MTLSQLTQISSSYASLSVSCSSFQSFEEDPHLNLGLLSWCVYNMLMNMLLPMLIRLAILFMPYVSICQEHDMFESWWSSSLSESWTIIAVAQRLCDTQISSLARRYSLAVEGHGPGWLTGRWTTHSSRVLTIHSDPLKLQKVNLSQFRWHVSANGGLCKLQWRRKSPSDLKLLESLEGS